MMEDNMGRETIYKSEQGQKCIQKHYEDYVQTLDFPVERRYIDTRFGKTHVLVSGPADGKPLFVFQGGNCINPMTMSWFSPLTKEYRVYAPDTIGHPGFSAETRISGEDRSYADWISDMMDELKIEHCAFVGPSFGGGIILRLAAFMPEKIDCAVLVSPAGIKMGSKGRMIKDILIPMILYKAAGSEKSMDRIGDIMSSGSMKKMDRDIIGDVFKYVKLEQDMPKLSEKHELQHYSSPTLVFTGEQDIFFPASRLKEKAEEIIPHLVSFRALDMGHFPSAGRRREINEEIVDFLREHY
jgi:pimeloyl-ACP methyl ester carboxylesterase